jgi:integrase
VDGIRQMLRRRCQAAGLRYMHPHLFRHGFAMLFLNNGMQLSAVSAAMGHSSQQITTDIYAHWLSDGLSREYETARARVERITAR